MDIESSSHHWAPALTNTHTHHTMVLAQPQPRNRKIHKVPPLLRREERNSDAYDPKVASFGPYHHGKEELQVGQEAKDFALQTLIEGSGRSREFLYQQLLVKVAYARDCYIDGATDEYSDEEFAEMMLLDACLLIYIMNLGPKRADLTKRVGELFLYLAYRDTFLMENQIPYEIVTLLINLIHGDKRKEAVNEYLQETIWAHRKPKKVKENEAAAQRTEPPLHLLEAFHRVMVLDRTPPRQKEGHQRRGNEDLNAYYKTFRSVKNLKAMGIHFKQSRYKSLKDINFKSCIFYSRLRLPTWYVTSLSKVFFPNMIAYELCPENQVADKVVISYVNFMKLLIVDPDDVRELREKNILFTSLQMGSDEELVRFYRELNTYCDDMGESFQGVTKDIQVHYDNLANTWMPQLIYTHFSSPWSFIAFCAAILLFALTSMQTYFTINPK